MKVMPFKKIYLQFKNYDGTKVTEQEITWSPVQINSDDIEYCLQSLSDKEVRDKKEISTERLKCDVCGNHPSVIIKTQFGQYCQLHAKYV